MRGPGENGENHHKTNKARCSTSSVSRKASMLDETPCTNMGRYTAEDKLAKLRQFLKENALSAYIVPTDDPHLCEMPPQAFRRREYISGFTGSAGTAVVTAVDTIKKGGTTGETGSAATETNGKTDEKVNGKANGASAHADDEGARALLWTDGRYFLQADNELEGTSWKLMKSGMADVPEPINWLADNLKPGSRIGIDPMVFTVSTARQFVKTLGEAQCSLIPVQ